MTNKEQLVIQPHALLPHKGAPDSLGKGKKNHREDLEAGSFLCLWQHSFTSGLEIRRPENSAKRKREIQHSWAELSQWAFLCISRWNDCDGKLSLLYSNGLLIKAVVTQLSSVGFSVVNPIYVEHNNNDSHEL